MKRIVTLFLVVFTSFLHSEEFVVKPNSSIGLNLSPNLDLNLKEESEKKKEGFVYLRFAAMEPDLSNIEKPDPGVGFGYRRLFSNYAVDFSFSGVGSFQEESSKIFSTYPKITYLRYQDDASSNTMYCGGGLAWGFLEYKYKDEQGNKYQETQRFVGLVPSVTIGYEFFHRSTVLSLELNLSQPALPVNKTGKNPGPIAEMFVGTGF